MLTFITLPSFLASMRVNVGLPIHDAWQHDNFIVQADVAGLREVSEQQEKTRCEKKCRMPGAPRCCLPHFGQCTFKLQNYITACVADEVKTQSSKMSRLIN